MPGLGTIINVAAIAAGGMGGLLFGRKMEKRYQDTLMSANAVCVLFLGIAGCMEQMLKITQNGLTSGGTMMMIGSFAIGALLGEWLNLDYHMEQFGEWLKRKTGNEKDAGFVDGFVEVVAVENHLWLDFLSLEEVFLWSQELQECEETQYHKFQRALPDSWQP